MIGAEVHDGQRIFDHVRRITGGAAVHRNIHRNRTGRGRYEGRAGAAIVPHIRRTRRGGIEDRLFAGADRLIGTEIHYGQGLKIDVDLIGARAAIEHHRYVVRAGRIHNERWIGAAVLPGVSGAGHSGVQFDRAALTQGLIGPEIHHRCRVLVHRDLVARRTAVHRNGHGIIPGGIHLE